MRTTFSIGDALYEKTLENANIDKSDIFREAIKTVVRVQAANRLAVLGGTMTMIQGVIQPTMQEMIMRSWDLFVLFLFSQGKSAAFGSRIPAARFPAA